MPEPVRPIPPAPPAPPAPDAPREFGPRDILELLRDRHQEILNAPGGVQVGAAPAPRNNPPQYAPERGRVRQNARLPITQEDINVEVEELRGNPVSQTWYAILNVPKRRKFLKRVDAQNWEWLDTEDDATAVGSQTEIIRILEEYLGMPDFNPAVEIYTKRKIQTLVQRRRRPRREQQQAVVLENRALREVLATARI